MILDRYIAGSVIRGTLSAILVFAALFAFIALVKQFKSVGTNDYGLIQAVIYVLLILPQRLYELAPSMILLGGLISLGTMAANSEIVVMRTSGITISRIVRSVIQTGFILAMFVAIAGEYLVPYTTGMAKTLRATAMDERMLSGGTHGLWARDGSRYFNVRDVLPDRQLRNISVYELDDKRLLKKVTHAERAHFENEHWILSEVKHSIISSKGVSTSTSKQEFWPALIRTEMFDVLKLDPADMSALDLMKYVDYFNENGLDAVPYQLAFWIKVFMPLTCVVMLLIAMPLVFTTTPRSGGTGQRVLVGLLLGILFYVFNRAVNHLGVVYGLPPILSASLPLMVVIIVTYALIRRIR
jgi:lipopolysaccharide export system permease protein